MAFPLLHKKQTIQNLLSNNQMQALRQKAQSQKTKAEKRNRLVRQENTAMAKAVVPATLARPILVPKGKRHAVLLSKTTPDVFVLQAHTLTETSV